MTNEIRRQLHLACGPLLLLAAVLALPADVFAFPARVALGTVLWMGWWWVTLPVAPGVTALLPIALNALFALVPMEKITSLYFSDIVILLLGANIISAAWELSGLDKRLALKALCFLGSSLAQHIVVWFLVAAALSAILPNAVVCALLTPIAVSMLRFLAGQDGRMPREALFILLACIAWGCGLGGLGTPLGGAMNLVAVSYLEQLSGHEFFYWDWVVTMLPVLCCLLAVNLLYLLAIRPRQVALEGSRAYFARQYAELPALSRDEALGLILFALPMLLAFARSLYAAWFPGLKPAHLFLIFGLLSFVLPRRDGRPLTSWKEVQPKIEWGLLLLFAGGLALGNLLIGTGAMAACARLVSNLQLDGGVGTVLLIVAGTMVLVEIASNTAAAAVSVPMVIGVVSGLGLDPVPYVFITAAAFNTGYMLPTSIRAIPVSYGLDTGYLFRHGAVLVLLTIAVLLALGKWYLL